MQQLEVANLPGANNDKNKMTPSFGTGYLGKTHFFESFCNLASFQFFLGKYLWGMWSS